MRYLLHPHRIRGAALLEWAVLASLIAILAIGSVLATGTGIRRYYQEAVDGLSGGRDSVALKTGGDRCVRGTGGDDVLFPVKGKTCYDLRGGDDIFQGSETGENIRILSDGGSGFSGSIVTGAGKDTITSKQNGTIDSGAGDDTIFLDTGSAPHGSIFSINTGPGTDSVELHASPAPSGAERNVLINPSGRLDALLGCARGGLSLKIGAGTTSALKGACDLFVSANTPGAALTRLSARGLASFSGMFPDLPALALDLDITGSTHPSLLSIPALQSGSIRYKVRSAPSADFAAVGAPGASDSTTMSIDISAQTGNFSLEGIGRSDWPVNVLYASGGVVTLIYPDEGGFSSMTAPSLAGKTGELRVRGCFDEITFTQGATVKTLPACSGADSSYTIPSPALAGTLHLVRNGSEDRIDTGPAALDLGTIRVGR